MFSSRTLGPGRASLGTDSTGVVDAVGEGVSSFSVGDRVHGIVFILDTHPGVGYSRASRVLASGGAYASTLPSPALMLRDLTSSVLPAGRAYVANASDRAEDCAELEQRLAAGEFKPFIEHVYPLAEAAEAFALAEAGGVVGKVMLEVQSH